MSLCPNCGNPWLESYEDTGKCDACGLTLMAGFPAVEPPSLEVYYPEPEPEA